MYGPPKIFPIKTLSGKLLEKATSGYTPYTPIVIASQHRKMGLSSVYRAGSSLVCAEGPDASRRIPNPSRWVVEAFSSHSPY